MPKKVVQSLRAASMLVDMFVRNNIEMLDVLKSCHKDKVLYLIIPNFYSKKIFMVLFEQFKYFSFCSQILCKYIPNQLILLLLHIYESYTPLLHSFFDYSFVLTYRIYFFSSFAFKTNNFSTLVNFSLCLLLPLTITSLLHIHSKSVGASYSLIKTICPSSTFSLHQSQNSE